MTRVIVAAAKKYKHCHEAEDKALLQSAKAV
jgi:hypothetical protein